MKNISLLKTSLWVIIIFILCSIPGNKIPSNPLVNIPHFDKIVHFGIFFILGIFVMSSLNIPKRTNKMRISLICMLIVFLYGGLIEVLQAYFFVNRSGDFYDLIADILGGLFAVLSFYYLKKQKDFLINRKPLNKIKFLNKIL